MPSEEGELTNGGATPFLHIGSLGMTDMVRLMFEPCSLCPNIDHLIREVEFHSSYILSTPWSPTAIELEGVLPPAVQSAMDAYEQGKLSTDSEFVEEEDPIISSVQNRELPTYRDYLETHNGLGRLGPDSESGEEEDSIIPSVQNRELPTYRDYLETHNGLGRLEHSPQPFHGYQPDRPQTELRNVQNSHESLRAPRVIPVNFSNDFFTSYRAETEPKPDQEEQGVAGWRSRIRGFTRVSPGIKRRVGRILG